MDYDTLWINQRNKSRQSKDNSHQQDRGHSKVYHDHHHTDEYDSLHPKTTFDSRRYDYETPFYKQQDGNRQCTRRTIFQTKNDMSTCECKKKLHKCTRYLQNQNVNYQLFTKYCASNFESTTHSNLNYACSCRIFQTRCQNIDRCTNNRNCDCDSKNPVCSCDMLKSLKREYDDSLESHSEFHQYDLPLKYVKKEKNLKRDSISERRLNKRKDGIYDYRQVINYELFC